MPDALPLPLRQQQPSSFGAPLGWEPYVEAEMPVAAPQRAQEAVRLELWLAAQVAARAQQEAAQELEQALPLVQAGVALVRNPPALTQIPCPCRECS